VRELNLNSAGTAEWIERPKSALQAPTDAIVRRCERQREREREVADLLQPWPPVMTAISPTCPDAAPRSRPRR
jgi:hypothetical protein